jgi:hypothetical protein
MVNQGRIRMAILHRGIIADGVAMTAVTMDLPYVKDEEPADLLARVSLKAGSKHRHERKMAKLAAVPVAALICTAVFLPMYDWTAPITVALIIVWTVWLVGHANRAIVFQKLVTWAALYSIRLTAIKILHEQAHEQVPVPDITIGTIDETRH